MKSYIHRASHVRYVNLFVVLWFCYKFTCALRTELICSRQRISNIEVNDCSNFTIENPPTTIISALAMKFRARMAPFDWSRHLSREYTLIRQRSCFPYYRDLYRPPVGGVSGYIFSLNSFRGNEDKTLATASHRFSSRLMTLISLVLFYVPPSTFCNICSAILARGSPVPGFLLYKAHVWGWKNKWINRKLLTRGKLWNIPL